MAATIISKEARDRYQQAYDMMQRIKYPTATKDFGTLPCKFPDTRTANGLTKFIENFVNWSGYRATRISSAGRVLNGRYIYGNTRKGTADLSLTIKGRAAMIEIKVGKDTPSPHQLKEQIKERAAGGCYEFISTPEQFFEWYDGFINSIL